MNILLSVVVSYAIGSVSPSFILGKIIKKTDIRTHGDGNAGALNTAATLGVVPGLITGLFDISKGILSLLLCRHFFALEGNLLLIPICAAIAGHMFPFYLRFRGGQGSATAIGLLLFFLIPMFAAERLPLDGLLILLMIIVTMIYISKGAESIGLVVLPMLLFYISANGGRSFPYLIASLLAGFLCGTTSYNFVIKKLHRGFLAPEVNGWRILFRAAAALIIPLYVLFGKVTAMVASCIAGVVFFGFDLYRFYSRGRDNALSALMTRLWNNDKTDRFSSTTILLFTALSVVLIFPKSTALLILSFLIGGGIFKDVFGAGLPGKSPIDRATLKICLSYLAGSLAAGYVVLTLLDLEFLPLIVGAAATPFAVLLSSNLDETFSVAMLSGAVMSVVGYLG